MPKETKRSKNSITFDGDHLSEIFPTVCGACGYLPVKSENVYNCTHICTTFALCLRCSSSTNASGFSCRAVCDRVQLYEVEGKLAR